MSIARGVAILDRGAGLLAPPTDPVRAVMFREQRYGLLVDTPIGRFQAGLNVWRADCEPDHDPERHRWDTGRPDVNRSLRLFRPEAAGARPEPVTINGIAYRLVVVERIEREWHAPRRAGNTTTDHCIRGDRVGGQRHSGLTEGASHTLAGILRDLRREVTHEEWRAAEDATLRAGRDAMEAAAVGLEQRAIALRKRGDRLVASIW